MMNSVNQLVNQYVALWNEPDATARYQTIADLWAENGIHFTRTREFHGLQAIAERVKEAHEQFVVGASCTFKLSSSIATNHNAVEFHWEMVSTSDESTKGEGYDFFLLDDDGRIRIDYQF